MIPVLFLMGRWSKHQVKNHQFWPNTGILGYLRFQMTKMKFWIRGSFCTVRSNFWCFMILSDKKRFLSKNFEKKFWKIKNFRFFQLAAEILQRLLRFLRRLQRLPCWDCRDSISAISAEMEPLTVPYSTVQLAKNTLKIRKYRDRYSTVRHS